MFNVILQTYILLLTPHASQTWVPFILSWPQTNDSSNGTKRLSLQNEWNGKYTNVCWQKNLHLLQFAEYRPKDSWYFSIHMDKITWRVQFWNILFQMATKIGQSLSCLDGKHEHNKHCEACLSQDKISQAILNWIIPNSDVEIHMVYSVCICLWYLVARMASYFVIE